MSDTTVNKETVRRVFDEVINLGELDIIDSLVDHDFETVTPQGALDRQGFAGYVEAWRAGFPDVRCEVEDLTAEDDRVAWAIRATGTHTATSWAFPPPAGPSTSTASTWRRSATAASIATP